MLLPLPQNILRDDNLTSNMYTYDVSDDVVNTAGMKYCRSFLYLYDFTYCSRSNLIDNAAISYLRGY